MTAPSDSPRSLAGDAADSGANPPSLGADLWERHAAWWQSEFTGGADPEYEEQILPLAAGHLAGAARALDLGCGEGQVARVAAAGGATVVGLDPAWAQLVTARDRAGGPAYLKGRAEALPFRDGAFDAVVTCLVLEHTEDLDGALDEVARVLAPGGRFVLLTNHPVFQTPGSGWIDDQVLDPPEQYWRVGEYLPETVTLEQVDAQVLLPFVHRPLGRYVNALAARGLLVTHMDEPAPPPGFLALAPEYAGAATIPRLLVLRTEKLR
ncbi:MAG TPA: class I SAM-dependent methyltransferase [Acidimicrobiales bacterium]|nr:class I SAM-dependent methyltransferase [Acidimicrobiales bacterium]